MTGTTTQELEQALAGERAALVRSLAALRAKLAPADLMREGRQALAAPLLSQLESAVRAQPLAAAVAGVALAALVLGRRAPPAEAPVPALAGTRFEALARWEDEGGPPREPLEPPQDWLTEAQGLRARASALLAQIDAAARRGLAPAARLTEHRAAVLAALGRETSQALGRGLESLGEAARMQALRARERVYLARIAAAGQGRAAVEQSPLALGAAMLAAGAALACLFPRTETEDRLLGAARDGLVDDLTAGARAQRGLGAADAWSGAGARPH